MTRRSSIARRLLRGAPAWAAIVAVIATMAGLFTFAELERRSAQSAREAQMLAQRLRTTGYQLELLTGDAVIDSLMGVQTKSVVRDAMAGGMGIWIRMGQLSDRVRKLAPGPEADRVARDVRRIYARGMILAGTTRASVGPNLSASQTFAPELARMRTDIAALTRV